MEALGGLRCRLGGGLTSKLTWGWLDAVGTTWILWGLASLRLGGCSISKSTWRWLGAVTTTWRLRRDFAIDLEMVRSPSRLGGGSVLWERLGGFLGLLLHLEALGGLRCRLRGGLISKLTWRWFGAVGTTWRLRKDLVIDLDIRVHFQFERTHASVRTWGGLTKTSFFECFWLFFCSVDPRHPPWMDD